MSTPEPTRLPSIQGETYQRATPEPMTVQEAESYVDSHSEGIVDCRSTNRHDFSFPRRGVVANFDAVDENDNLIAHYLCRSCGCAIRREVWTATYYKREKLWRYEFLDADLVYQKNADDETYLLPPGSGRARPRQFREASMTGAMKGQSPGAIRKQLKRNKR